MKEQRVIKFRAWDGEKMHYPQAEKYVIRFDGVIGEFNETSQMYSTKDWQIQQFTGLLDRNGKEIYEGDLLKYSWLEGDEIETEIAAVIFEDGSWSSEIPGHYSEYLYDELYSDAFTVEVIGDIYTTPELLKH